MDDLPFIFSLIAGAIGFLGSIFSGFAARRSARAAEKAAIEPDISDRIALLRSNLASSASLIKQIETEFQLQVAALDRIKAESEENQRLAELTKEQADAVRSAIASANEQGSRPAKRQQWLFFLAGLLFSLPLGIVVNLAYDLIFRT